MSERLADAIDARRDEQKERELERTTLPLSWRNMPLNRVKITHSTGSAIYRRDYLHGFLTLWMVSGDIPSDRDFDALYVEIVAADHSMPAARHAIELRALFDRARRLPGLGITLFERHLMGAANALRAWAAANGVALEERPYSGGHVLSTTPESKLDIVVHVDGKAQP